MSSVGFGSGNMEGEWYGIVAVSYLSNCKGSEANGIIGLQDRIG